MRTLFLVRSGFAVCAALAMLAGCSSGGPSSVGLSVPTQNVSGKAALADVLYTFQGGADGASPYAGLLAVNGTLYGTTFIGGDGPSGGYGTVFKMSTSGTKTVLYKFQGGTDAGNPQTGLTAGKGGVLYGATDYGGDATLCAPGCGAAYELVPKGSGYTEKVIYAFQGGSDGSSPLGGLLLDKSGALYGTTVTGGGSEACVSPIGETGCGVVFKLTPAGRKYTESVLYSFQGGTDGAGPRGALIADSAGALYGTTQLGGGGSSACTSSSGITGCGTAFKLTPAGSGYTESVIYRFQGGSDSWYPRSALLASSGGKLLGVALRGGANGAGTVYRLTPGGRKYTERILISFNGKDGAGPHDENGLLAGKGGALYGTTGSGGTAKCLCGAVFKLTRSGSGYTERVLFSFQGARKSDGNAPYGSLVSDSSGELYGTTFAGGSKKNYGIVFKVSP